MKRSLTAAATAVALATAVVGIAPPAQAGTNRGISHASAARISIGSGLHASVSTGGDLGGLLDFLTPVLNQVVNPLTSNLNSLSDDFVSDLAAGLTGVSFAADSSSSAGSMSGDYPSCSSPGWSDGNCFGPLLPAVAAPPLVTVTTGTLQGYAGTDDTGAKAQSRAADLGLNVLGLQLGTLGAANASASCTAAGDCTASSTLTGLNLLGGKVLARTGSTGLEVSLNGSAYAPLATYSGVTSVTAGLVSATAQSAGNMLQLRIGITLSQLLSALGIGASLDDLNTADAGTSVSLILTIGAGSVTTGGTATAYGLRIGLGLDAAVSLSVLGLVSANVNVAAGANALVTVDLGYVSAKAPETFDTSGAPPDLL